MNNAVDREGATWQQNWPALSTFQHISEFWLDSAERSILFCDAMRRRAEIRAEHAAKIAPHVLTFKCEPVIDGRTLDRPVNYVLARVKPPAGVSVDEKKRPFIIVDPRAGHGPGIGGFKPQSEIGVAFKAGHPCYLIGFLPTPEPGQTIEDIARAEAHFVEYVSAAHPAADGKPVVVGNCQAGWAVMMLAATRPELFGPIVIAGSPLSYWAGVRGHNPMRYTGGLLGGSWMAALAGDLGAGKFDGAWLVANFELLNPSNTFWKKHYNLYSNIDKEVARYLQFEQWWGAHVLLNAEEMQFIVDELFVGNKLAKGEITWSDGTVINLRNIRSPIVVFCSRADNITPPQQALQWIVDLYDSVDDIRTNGQTIVYAIHDTVGHLGIFVSGSVAEKEHGEFTSNIDLIDVLPPGLYEAVIVPKENGASDLIEGEYLVRFETRTLDDIRKLGGNDEEDNRRFAAAAHISDVNLSLYRAFMQPWVRFWCNGSVAETLRQLHPLRLQYDVFAFPDAAGQQLSAAADQIRENRHLVSPDNPAWQLQQQISRTMEQALDAFRDWRDSVYELSFTSIYGAPHVQAMAGLSGAPLGQKRKLSKDAAYLELMQRRSEDLRRSIAEGGPREALIRALLYVRMPDGIVDERGFNFLRRVRDETGGDLSIAGFKDMFRKQYFALLLDEPRALEALPKMLAAHPERAGVLANKFRELIDVVGVHTPESKQRLAEMERVLDDAMRCLKGAPEREARSTNRTHTRPSKRAKHVHWSQSH
jgi:pimeloyl-ACP methyl ester carboxylesterase